MITTDKIETERLVIYKFNEKYSNFHLRDNIFNCIGSFCFHRGMSNIRQIGYRIWDSRDWNKGYCTEALKALLPFVPQEYRNLEIMDYNLKSQNVAKKCGFLFVGSVLRNVNYPGKFTIWMYKERAN